MERTKIIQKLEELGLTKGEAKVYLALLELGPSTKSSIVRKSRVSPSIVYEILERLMNKGLVSSVFIEKIRYFEANEPSFLLQLVKEEKRKAKKKEKIARSLIPLLKLKREVGKKFLLLTKVYEGVKGFKAMLQEVEKDLKGREEWLAMGVTSYKRNQFNRLWVNWHKRVRPKYKVKARFIFCEKGTDYFKALKKTPLSKVRYIPSKSSVCVTVVGNKTLVMKYTDPPSFLLIKNEEMAKFLKDVFEIMWRNAVS